jgi:hypothetical protein
MDGGLDGWFELTGYAGPDSHVAKKFYVGMFVVALISSYLFA